MSKESGTVADSPNTFPERLQWAIERQPWEGRRRGLRLFQSKMEARASELRSDGEDLVGYHLSSIQGYVSGEVEPLGSWIREAADVLGVREAWLSSGHGAPTEAEERVRIARAGEESESWFTERLWSRLDPLCLPAGERARASVLGLWAQLTEDRTLEDVVGQEGQVIELRGDRIASELAEALTAPIEAIGVKVGAHPEERDSYLVLMCEAISTYLRGSRRAEAELDEWLHPSEEED